MSTSLRTSGVQWNRAVSTSTRIIGFLAVYIASSIFEIISCSKCELLGGLRCKGVSSLVASRGSATISKGRKIYTGFDFNTHVVMTLYRSDCYHEVNTSISSAATEGSERNVLAARTGSLIPRYTP